MLRQRPNLAPGGVLEFKFKFQHLYLKSKKCKLWFIIHSVKPQFFSKLKLSKLSRALSHLPHTVDPSNTNNLEILPNKLWQISNVLWWHKSLFATFQGEHLQYFFQVHILCLQAVQTVQWSFEYIAVHHISIQSIIGGCFFIFAQLQCCSANICTKIFAQLQCCSALNSYLHSFSALEYLHSCNALNLYLHSCSASQLQCTELTLCSIIHTPAARLVTTVNNPQTAKTSICSKLLKPVCH